MGLGDLQEQAEVLRDARRPQSPGGQGLHSVHLLLLLFNNCLLSVQSDTGFSVTVAAYVFFFFFKISKW